MLRRVLPNTGQVPAVNPKHDGWATLRHPLLRTPPADILRPNGLGRITDEASHRPCEAIEAGRLAPSPVVAPSFRNGGLLRLLLPVLLLTLTAVAPSAEALPEFSLPGVVGDDPLREGILQGFLLIFFSELGDKTFFIALLLALQADKNSVFVGTFGALAIMTVISVGLGQVLHQVDEFLPDVGIPFDDILAIALLVWFGISTLNGAGGFTEKANEEYEEAEEVLEEQSLASKENLALIFSTFLLVFAAEWGDKSFLATIALAAASSPLGVIIGAVAGHGVATAVAVSGGAAMSKYVSERTVAYVGGSLFLIFAAATALDLVTGTP